MLGGRQALQVRHKHQSQGVVYETHMVLHDIGAWKAVSILKKGSRVHREESVLNFGERQSDGKK
jgi:hypothetical protein